MFSLVAVVCGTNHYFLFYFYFCHGLLIAFCTVFVTFSGKAPALSPVDVVSIFEFPLMSN